MEVNLSGVRELLCGENMCWQLWKGQIQVRIGVGILPVPQISPQEEEVGKHQQQLLQEVFLDENLCCQPSCL